MRHRRLALTGPSAAALYQLDGFRDHVWPDLWCAPVGSHPGDRIIRTRDWPTTTAVGEIEVCPLATVLRHLHAVPVDLRRPRDGIAPIDRVELAVEHALRDGATIGTRQGARTPGDTMLHEVLQRRGNEPATGSYAETRAVQLLRQWDITPWRQVPVLVNGTVKFRADFMIPFDSRRKRPEVFRTCDGLLIEVDSRKHHEENFDHDKTRGSTYDELGYHWIIITPNQIEHQTKQVHRAVIGAFRRAGRTLS